jgi:hypothetical protein
MSAPQPEDRLADVPTTNSVTRRVRLAICAWLAAMAACNLFASLLLLTPAAKAAAALLLGLTLAQLSLLVFWGALGPRLFAVRWFQAAAAGELLLAAAVAAPWLVSSGLPSPLGTGDGVLAQVGAFAFSLPACLLVASGVLALLSPHGYRLVGWDSGDQRPEVAPFQFTLGDLLGVMVAVAVTMGMLRWGFQSVLDLPHPDEHFAAMVIPPFLGSILAIVIVFSAVETLLAPSEVSRRGCVWLFLIGWLLAFLPFLVVMSDRASSLEQALLLVVAFFGGLIGPLIGSLLWLRRLGITLETPQATTAASGNPFAKPDPRDDSERTPKGPFAKLETRPHGPAEG